MLDSEGFLKNEADVFLLKQLKSKTDNLIDE